MEFKENELLLGRYRLVKQIGKGGFSVVWQALDEITNVELAIKIYAPDKGLDEKGVRQFTKEYRLTQPLNYPNLLKPTHYDVLPDLNAPFLVMPFCKKGSLSASLEENGTLKEDDLAKLMVEIGGALAYLHRQHPPILHQDIKPDNVLMADDGAYMLTDFGISNKMRSTLKKSTVGQSALTVAYAPPEKYSNKGISEPSDIFSFGIMLYECLTGEVPWGGDGGVMLLKGAHLPDLPDTFPDRLNKVIKACLELDIAKRPTATQLQEVGTFYQQNGYWPKPEEFIASLAGDTTMNSKKPKSSARKTEVLETSEPMERAGMSGAKTMADGSGQLLSGKGVGRKSKGRIWAIVAVVVIGLGAGGFFIYNINASDPSDPGPLAMGDSVNNEMDTVASDSIYQSLSFNAEDSTQLANNEGQKDEDKEVAPETPSVNNVNLKKKPETPSKSELAQQFEDGKALFEAEEYTKAFLKFMELANQGHAEATWYVGYQKREGLGTLQNYDQAVEYYIKAGDRGDPAGYNSAGYMYDQGMGIPADNAKAFTYYLKSAQMGYHIAQFNIGLYYDEGMGGQARDWKKAFEWYKKSADQSYATAQRMVGEFYLFGAGGVYQNKSEASRYFRMASANGDAVSSKYLEVMNALDGRETVYKETNSSGDEMWVRPATSVLEPKLLSGLGSKWEYRVYYKLGESSTIEIFPLFKEAVEKRGITDDVKYSDYSSCEKLTSNAGYHELYITNNSTPRREIGYVYINGYVQNTDLELKIPAAVCWPSQ